MNSTILQICGQLAPLSSVLFYTAPIPTMLQMRRDKHIASGVPLLPYTTMVMSNLLWVSYGILRWSPAILLVGYFFVSNISIAQHSLSSFSCFILGILILFVHC
jgi:hypothetical protein